MADTVNPQITDAVAADAPSPTPTATRAFCIGGEQASVALARSIVDDRSHYEVELSVELDVPVGLPGGIRIPLTMTRTIELAGTEQATALANWIRATTETETQPTEPSDANVGPSAVLRYTVAGQSVRVSLEHDLDADRYSYRVALDEFPVTLPLPNPWSPCKVALTVHAKVQLSPEDLAGLATWIEQNAQR